MPELRLAAPAAVVDILLSTGMAPSKSEVRRLVQQGGVQLDGVRLEDFQQTIEPGGEHVLQVGRRKFLKLLPG
jgi:tyrosyl-tRNA synthetase